MDFGTKNNPSPPPEPLIPEERVPGEEPEFGPSRTSFRRERAVDEVPDEPEPAQPGEVQNEMTLRREGERILARLTDRDHVIALCVDAKQYESPELAARLDGGLATQTVILLGVMFSMLATSLTSLVSLLFPEKLRSITFWTMGSLQGSDYAQAALLAAALALAGGTLYFTARELNAFTLGEEQAGNLGVNVRSCKLRVLFCVAALTGVSVAVGGGIGFVGLLVPHMTRRLLGPDHSRLLPGAACFGATFLLLADLLSRVLLRPLELPVGAVTSLVGAGAFVYIFYTTRRKNQGC